MSTIASPRDRRPPISPTPSSRPSIDTPPPSQQSHLPPPTTSKRTNRAALREYYNLVKNDSSTPPPQQPQQTSSEVPHSEIDDANFNAEEFVSKKLAESGLDELLRLYARVVGEIRALDAEKKGLVYDNYSKLIAATETIRKMRSNMDPLNPMASMLDPKIAQIHNQAASLRDDLRATVPPSRRTAELAAEVLALPGKMRVLVEQGREDEARKAWDVPRRLLVRWMEEGVGGEDVRRCLEEGDGILAGAGSEEGN